jgi:hypothetical protein
MKVDSWPISRKGKCKEGLLMDGCAAAVVLGALVRAPAGRFFTEGVVMEVVVEIGRVG